MTAQNFLLWAAPVLLLLVGAVAVGVVSCARRAPRPTSPRH